MESALPGLNLGWTISDEGQFIPLPQREEWLARGRPGGRGFPLICNGNESHLVTLSGLEPPEAVSSGRQVQFEVHAALPLSADIIPAAEDVLEALAEGARAFWGHTTPFSAGVDIARQMKGARNPQAPPRGLPALMRPWDIRAPEIPHRLGWLNYWSAAAAQAIGFPDPSRDADMLLRSRRTATGGWIVRLTEAPLQLDIPAHMNALLRAYERFPEIGGRAPSG